MDLTRRYFILDRPTGQELKALEACIGENHTQRYNLDFTQIIIKTNNYIIQTFLNNDTSALGVEYSLNAIRQVVSGPEWELPDTFLYE